ncbi:MAG: 23S rRNA (pseudouridine(1915)-N(3))-methyltransferase RlmH [Bacteroidetes bacterium]|nr:23S rRNA (pseudouridine(1915)-N(3))-methyltransferase RlmH [Bacteroidota bacterium]
MKIELWQIGKTAFRFLEEGMAEYEKRLKRYIPFELTTIPDVKKGGKLPMEQLIEKEGEAILSRLDTTDHLLLLDERGRQYRSVEFAHFIEKLQHQSHRKVIFLIGGAYGFSEAVKTRANGKISLSKMTFSHQMVRLFILEQLYRAQTILRNEPYHHE